jgi:hypothetical protein
MREWGIRYYVDADILGLGHILSGLRGDIGALVADGVGAETVCMQEGWGGVRPTYAAMTTRSRAVP